MFESLIGFVREQYGTDGPVPLHEPRFFQAERRNVLDTLDSTFVSTVGEYVGRLESMTSRYSGIGHAVATVNGTAALHTALMLAGVRDGDLVVTQPLTFVATCNAIRYCGADPAFVDVDTGRLSLCPAALADFLEQRAEVRETGCFDRETGRRIGACLPVHTLGHPADMERICAICERWGISVVEDAAESLGSWLNDRHTGGFGVAAALSFNGNKVITTGGGGMILTPDETVARRGRHLTTTARVPDGFEFTHDEVGYNYRMPNLNAALGCAQMGRLESIVRAKREVAAGYAELFSGSEFRLIQEPREARSNYWLNAVVCPDRRSRDELLQRTNDHGVMTRPAWRLMPDLPMYQGAEAGELSNARWIGDRMVCLPSSIPASFEAEQA